MNPSSTLLTSGLRRFGVSFLSKRLAKESEALSEKKHPERKRNLSNVVASKRYFKKWNIQAKKDIRESHKKHYETDPIYRASTIRPAKGGEKYDIQLAGPLRKVARSDPNFIMRTHAQNLLKKFTDFRDATPWPLLLKKEERKKHKKRKMEDARAKLDLRGEV